MTARSLLGSDDCVLLATAAKRSHNTTTETAFDFGTPNDIYVPTLSNYDPHMRLVFVITATTAGTSDALTFAIKDAEDTDGTVVIDEATVDVAATSSWGADALAATTGDAFCVFGVRLQKDRPWLRVTTDAAGTTDTFVVMCRLFGIKAGA